MSMDQNKDDADFEAFLRGEGDLAEGLDALSQPSPSASVDSAILARARADVERDARHARLQADAKRAREANEARGQAANDAPSRGKWGLPGGIAATVLAGVLGHQVWNHNADVERAAMAPATMREHEDIAAPPPPPSPAPAPAQATVIAPEATQAAQQVAVPKRAPAQEKRSVPAVQAPAPLPPPAPAPVADAIALPSVPTEFYRSAPREPARADKSAPLTYSAPLFERAPAPAPAPAVAAEAPRHVDITGSRVGGSALRAAPLVFEPDAWLKQISTLLADGDKVRALVEWRKFRALHPDYPVPEPLATAIKAAQE